MTVWADEEGFDWKGRNGLYKPNYKDGQDAVLIPGRWVQNWLNDNDYGDMSFSKILRDRGLMVGGTKRPRIAGRQNRAWPIAASETDHTFENSHQPQDADDDDAPEDLR